MQRATPGDGMNPAGGVRASRACAPGRWAAIGIACSFYYLTTMVVVLGVLFGSEFVKLCGEFPEATRSDFVASFAAWDGRWYARISREGYTYDPSSRSSVAFFPAFPLCGRALAAIFGMRAETALFLVAQACLLGSFILTGEYLRSRFPRREDLAEATLLALGLFPTTFYSRMAYSESLFLLLGIAAMFGQAAILLPSLVGGY